MSVRKLTSILLAMILALLSGGFVATTSAQAADDCQVTITGGEVTALSTALNGSSTVICVSGTFIFSGAVFPATKSSLTIKGDPTAIFESGPGLTSNTLLVTANGEGGPGIANLTIENIVFDGLAGNGRAIDAQNIVVRNSTFKNFSSSGSGGAISTETGNITITDSEFLNNTAGAYGGAIGVSNGANVVNAANIEITNSKFTGNSAPNDYTGGAIYIQNGSLTVLNSSFDSNQSTEVGGAIDVQNSTARTVSITNSSFSNNTTFTAGGAIRVFGSDVSISSSAFSLNKANGYTIFSGDGGAIYADQKVTVSNSTFFGNEARGGSSGGGAIYAARTGEVTYSTFLNNSASEALGNSIYKSSASSSFTVGASIFASSSTDPELVSAQSNPSTDLKFTDQGANLFKNPTPAEASCITSSSGFFVDDSRYGITLSQLFGSATPQLADNGGPTKTIALLEGSVAINKAEPINVSSYPAKDQRGYDRRGGYDSGAFEFGAVAAVVTPPNTATTPAAPTASTTTNVTTATTTLAATGTDFTSRGIGVLSVSLVALGALSLVSVARRAD